MESEDLVKNLWSFLSRKTQGWVEKVVIPVPGVSIIVFDYMLGPVDVVMDASDMYGSDKLLIRRYLYFSNPNPLSDVPFAKCVPIVYDSSEILGLDKRPANKYKPRSYTLKCPASPFGGRLEIEMIEGQNRRIIFYVRSEKGRIIESVSG